MKDYRYQPFHYLLWSYAILTLLLAIVLTVRSLNIQRTHDPICRGIAGAGFPLTFVCDTLGESPTGSWGKIDEADGWFPTPFFFIDVLFYMVLLWMPWFTLKGILRWMRRRQLPS
jgi:hypothetical protein